MTGLFLLVLFILAIYQRLSIAEPYPQSNADLWGKQRISLNANCVVSTSQKKDCGYVGITINNCKNAGCCWEVPAAGVSAPWCFYPGTDSPTYNPTVTPSASPTTASPSASPTTSAPSLSFSPSTIKPTTVAPTHKPTNPVNSSSASSKNKSTIIAAIVVVAIIFIAALCFVVYAYCFIYRKSSEGSPVTEKKADKTLEIETGTVTNESRETSYQSIYTHNRYDNFRFNRRDLVNDTVDLEEDEWNSSLSHHPISWYEDHDHGFVN